MSEENDSKSTQVSSESTETVKLPDLYTAMAGICYNNSQKHDENKPLIENNQDTSTEDKTHQPNDSNNVDGEKHSTDSNVPHSQNYHVTETKNQSVSSHPLPNFSSWEQLSCPSLQNYHGSQIINPLAAAAAQYNEYYNLSSRSSGVVYEDWQYPVYYSNYYDTGTDMSKYCDQKSADASYEKSKMTPENLLHDSGNDRTCSTPDLVLSVLQMENQIKNEMNPGKDRLNHWYSPVSSPDCSPAASLTAESPAPSTEQDSGFFSEDPVSPIFMSHKQTVTQLEETNQKYYVYVPESTEDWKNYHSVPMMRSDMNRKMVNKSAMLSGWKSTPSYPMFSPEIMPRNNSYKPESDMWQMSKYPQFSMSMVGKGHKLIKTKAGRPTRCVTPIPSTVTSASQVQSDKISSSLPTNMMQVHNTSAKICFPEVESAPTQSKTTKDIVNSFINRKSPNQVAQIKPNQPIKRKLPDVEEKLTHCSKRIRHNEPLNQHGISVMQCWYDQNRENPYPTKQDKEDMARLGGITITQVKSWFANKRNRTNNTKPKVQKRNVEEKLLELCHQLASDARKSTMDNAFVIQQLSAIIDEHHSVR